MAVTGLILLAFVTGHLVGNLQIFAHPDKINGYAHFLQSLGPVLWAVRLGMLACVLIHVWAAITLVLENRAARGSNQYGVSKWLKASVASRYMRLSGAVIAAFIVYHILHFTVGVAQAASFKTALHEYTMASEFHIMGFPIVAAGTQVHDVWSMVYLGFSNPWVSIAYMVAIALLTLHLWHGVSSMFQTVGLLNENWSCFLRKVAALFCIAYFLGNLAIPGAILAGCVKPQANTAAASISTCTTSTCNK